MRNLRVREIIIWGILVVLGVLIAVSGMEVQRFITIEIGSDRPEGFEIIVEEVWERPSVKKQETITPFVTEDGTIDRVSTVELRGFVGEITVQPAPGDELIVTSSVQAYANTEEQAQEKVNLLYMEWERVGNRGILSLVDEGLSLESTSLGILPDRGRGIYTNIVMEVPDGMHVDFAASGSVVVEQVRADITARNTGRFTARDVHGDINVAGGLGAVQLTDINGNAYIERPHVSVNISDISGDVTGILQFQFATIENVAGNVSLVLDGANVRLTGIQGDVEARERSEAGNALRRSTLRIRDIRGNVTTGGNIVIDHENGNDN